MGLETVLLKGARVQKFLAALFYLVSAVRFKLYIMCAPAKNFGILCTLALLHPWIQTRPRQSDSSHIFGPCRPRVAVFRAGWGRNRSPPGQARVWPHRGYSESARKCGADIFLFCKCPKLGIRSRLCPTKILPFGEGKQSTRPTLSDGTLSGQ